jgi:pSer/pThr/pTyr-binding forkhead associated (FHA) protein
VALIKQEIGIDPVVGWLVCIDGKEKGRDYRIHSDNNFIGRSEKMDICIRGDETISRENHAVISFDSRDKVYYFSPGDGRSIVRLNDKAIFSTSQLQANDTIEIGKTKLMFIPLCGERFEWL